MNAEDRLAARTEEPDPLADPLADPPAAPPAAEPPLVGEPNAEPAAPEPAAEPAPAEEPPPAAEPEAPAEEPAPAADPGAEWDAPEVEVPVDEPPAEEPAPAEEEPAAEPAPEPAAEPEPAPEPEAAPAADPAPAVEPDPAAGDDPPESAGDANGSRTKGSSVRPYALLEGRRLREIVAEVVDQAGGTLTIETLEKLIETDSERFRERFFRPLDQVEAVNKTNAVRALHKRESGQGKQRVHLAIFPAHYWTPETMLVGTETTVSVETVDDDD